MTGISELTKYLQCTKTFDKLKLLKLGGGCALAELKVEEEHTNSLGGLHGGFSATLVDMVSTYALSTHRNGDYPTVSVDMFMR
ncbi:unnamed protein product [Brassicogethes aeneus]|uniref:Thioesterase domain-containing protein n=1 Tax=Brassicogethes aeneus TaxID=1431903 RepID=A0A9P0B2P3_BRAAE|nr:unnamed protein product [Brassicogethes aeneus]